MEDYTDEVSSEYELLLPVLIAAGDAESNGYTWNFTTKGIERAERLEAAE